MPRTGMFYRVAKCFATAFAGFTGNWRGGDSWFQAGAKRAASKCGVELVSDLNGFARLWLNYFDARVTAANLVFKPLS